MLSVLFSRRWLGALALSVGFAVAAFYLGQWQWGRYEEKAARADRIATHYTAEPVQVADVLGSDPMPISRNWTRVTATGRYAAGGPLYVRNRPRQGTYGYEVLEPFDLSSGGTLLVDRGWVANSAQGAEVLPQVPPAPSGRVTLVGWLRQSEPNLHRDLPTGQLASINLDEAAAELQVPLLGAYLVMQSETTPSGSTPPRPEPLGHPDTGLGPHRAYAFQWWGAMPVGFVLIWFGIRREADEAAGTPRPKKVRIWDEEDA